MNEIHIIGARLSENRNALAKIDCLFRVDHDSEWYLLALLRGKILYLVLKGRLYPSSNNLNNVLLEKCHFVEEDALLRPRYKITQLVRLG